MLKKSSRLTSTEVEEALKKGHSIVISLPKAQKSLISAKFLAKPGIFKAAAVAPKSVAKSAVVRNRLRRAVYRAIAGFPTPQRGGIAVFFVRSIPKAPLTAAFSEEISIFLDKISVL
jgi:RNase P protein component